MRLIITLFIIASISSSQENIDKLIQHVLNDSKDSAVYYLPKIEQDYPNNASVLFLKGLLEQDGEKAMQIFSLLYNTHPTSEYGDDAVMKVAEYYYSAGLYIQASEWLKKMPIYYSRSSHIERSLKLFLNSLIVSGHQDTAIFYSRVFQRQFPDLDIETKIQDLIQNKETQNSNNNISISKSPGQLVDNKKQSEINSNSNVYNNTVISSSHIFSLQTGAFSSIDNAETQKIDLLIVGFNAKIVELYKNSNILYAVRVGSFSSKGEAEQTGALIKKKLDLDTIIVENN